MGLQEPWELTPSGLKMVNAMDPIRWKGIAETVMPNILSGMEETLANLKQVAEAG